MKCEMNRDTKIFVTVKRNGELIRKTFRTTSRAVRFIGNDDACVIRHSSHGYTSETCGRYLYKNGKRCSLNRGFTAEMYDRWNNWSKR